MRTDKFDSKCTHLTCLPLAEVQIIRVSICTYETPHVRVITAGVPRAHEGFSTASASDSS